jgi:NAD(P)-dependent dehydrogenase (short-subunit alcohol dehydrogenase family)
MPLNPPLKNWAGRTVWLVGASTGIGRATAEKLHGLGARVVVSARNKELLYDFAAAHAGSLALPLDATDPQALRAAALQIQASHGGLDLVGYFAGTYTPMRATGFDLQVALQHVQVNYVAALSLLDAVLPLLLERGRAGQAAHLSLVSSVAGYRGLPQSLAYGPTKAALINLAETLYQDLHPLGVGVSLICPGFVETPLTAQNAFKMPALLTPAQAADAVVAGWESGDFEIHFPKRFTLGLKALQLLPYRAYFAAVKRSTGL